MNENEYIHGLALKEYDKLKKQGQEKPLIEIENAMRVAKDLKPLTTIEETGASGADDQPTATPKKKGKKKYNDDKGGLFWLKLWDTFFSDPKIKRIRRSENGATKIVIYEKLLLSSLELDGKILIEIYEGDTLYNAVAYEIDEDPEDVEQAITELKRLRLIEVIEDPESPEIKIIILTELDYYVGSDTDKTRKKRYNTKLGNMNLLEKINAMIEE